MTGILFGCLFFIIGLFLLLSHRKFFKHAIILPGIITGHSSFEHTDSKGRQCTLYRKVISFEFDGQTRQFTNYRSASSSKPKIGTSCKVGVNPNDIQDVRIYSTFSIIILWFMMASGLLFIVLGIGQLTAKL